MDNLDNQVITDYVNKNIVFFHEKRIERLKKLNINILLKKNPYLFKAKNVESAGELLNGFLDAFLSSSEEKMFGELGK